MSRPNVTDDPDPDHEGSRQRHQRALDILPGGVSHNVRYADPYPIYMDRAEGATIVDVDGNEYVDFWNNHGASLLGHSHPDVVDAVTAQVEEGIHLGTVNEYALELAERVPGYVPSAERVRFCVSGTEATMYAVRLARAHTGRDRILKVESGWHGGNTDLAHAVYPPFDEPTTAGLPPGVGEHVHTFRAYDPDEVGALLEEYRGEVAAVIFDPRRGGVLPDEEFLAFIDDARDEHGFQLVFDEVVTGFRVSPGSYQARVGVVPDLTTVGKIVGGGLPIGAICGRHELFEPARPDVDVDPSERVLAGGGTFSMHPSTARAGLATIDAIESESAIRTAEDRAADIASGVRDIFDDEDVDAEVRRFSSLFWFVFEPEGDLEAPADVRTATNREATVRFQEELIDRGYFFSLGAVGNASARITGAHVDGLVDAAGDAIRAMRRDGAL